MKRLFPSRTILVIHFFLLLALLFAACQGGNNKAAPPPVGTDSSTVREPQAHDSPQTFDNILSSTNRQANFTKSELDSAKALFNKHFTVAPSNKPVSDTVLRIPWSSLAAAGKSAVPAGKDPIGIYINYGLDGTAFHPVFRFMFLDNGGMNEQVSTLKAFSFTNGKMVVETNPTKYEDAYSNNIRILRNGSGTPDKLRLDDPNDSDDLPDPTATWFSYPCKVRYLLQQNPGVTDTVLVLSCISEPVPYRALGFLDDDPEYRHFIALHVADGSRDLLNDQANASNVYQNRAMDLGGMCPPLCPPKKP
ncbi:MAG: hypothetical protein JST45_05135 [Bacteroidetes bacterium]|nr:hypothetical protein [Bacteroidota bacterium]